MATRQWVEIDERGTLRGNRLLVVEDDALILMELETVLMDAGAEIVWGCQTVQAALALCGAEGLSAAVLDVRIGEETIAPVARELASRGIPFMFYTGQLDTDLITSGWAAKVLPKPSSPRTIVAAVAEILRQDPRSADCGGGSS